MFMLWGIAALKDRKGRVDVNEISTWTKYRKRLCSACRANCCTMPVEVKISDLVRMEVIDAFEAEEPIKKLAKKLRREGVIDHFHFGTQTFTLVRFARGDCLYLDPGNRRCAIYDKRPDTCRKHPRVGPRPGFCPYEQRSS
jgi:Fe-S-cluster containining protein